MRKNDRATFILDKLNKIYPDPSIPLQHNNIFELLIAVLLSAQCTDERVNAVTKPLFKKYKSAEEFSKAPLKTLEKEIHSTGFFRSKAKHIKNTCTIIHNNYSGEVPDSIEKLTELPGVGRKTANVVMGSWFKIPTGVVVDTHVKRISKKLDLTKNLSPEAIEKDLMKTLKKKDWIHFSHMMIWHGRKVCNARKPKSVKCPILDDCPSGKL